MLKNHSFSICCLTYVIKKTWWKFKESFSWQIHLLGSVFKKKFQTYSSQPIPHLPGRQSWCISPDSVIYPIGRGKDGIPDNLYKNSIVSFFTNIAQWVVQWSFFKSSQAKRIMWGNGYMHADLSVAKKNFHKITEHKNK